MNINGAKCASYTVPEVPSLDSIEKNARFYNQNVDRDKKTFNNFGKESIYLPVEMESSTNEMYIYTSVTKSFTDTTSFMRKYLV